MAGKESKWHPLLSGGKSILSSILIPMKRERMLMWDHYGTDRRESFERRLEPNELALLDQIGKMQNCYDVPTIARAMDYIADAVNRIADE